MSNDKRQLAIRFKDADGNEIRLASPITAEWAEDPTALTREESMPAALLNKKREKALTKVFLNVMRELNKVTESKAEGASSDALIQGIGADTDTVPGYVYEAFHQFYNSLAPPKESDKQKEAKIAPQSNDIWLLLPVKTKSVVVNDVSCVQIDSAHRNIKMSKSIPQTILTVIPKPPEPVKKTVKIKVLDSERNEIQLISPIILPGDLRELQAMQAASAQQMPALLQRVLTEFNVGIQKSLKNVTFDPETESYNIPMTYVAPPVKAPSRWDRFLQALLSFIGGSPAALPPSVPPVPETKKAQDFFASDIQQWDAASWQSGQVGRITKQLDALISRQLPPEQKESALTQPVLETKGAAPTSEGESEILITLPITVDYALHFKKLTKVGDTNPNPVYVEHGAFRLVCEEQPPAGFVSMKQYEADPTKYPSDHCSYTYDIELPALPSAPLATDAALPVSETKHSFPGDAKVSGNKKLKITSWNLCQTGMPSGYVDRNWPSVDQIITDKQVLAKFAAEERKILVEIVRRIDLDKSDVLCFQETPNFALINEERAALQKLETESSGSNGSEEHKRKAAMRQRIQAMETVYEEFFRKIQEKGYQSPSLDDYRLTANNHKSLLTFVKKDEDLEVRSQDLSLLDLPTETSTAIVSCLQKTVIKTKAHGEFAVVNLRLSFSHNPQQYEDEIIRCQRSSEMPIILVGDTNRGVLNAEGRYVFGSKIPGLITKGTQAPGTSSYDGVVIGVKLERGKNEPIVLPCVMRGIDGEIVTNPSEVHKQQAEQAKLRHLISLNDPFLHYLREINPELNIYLSLNMEKNKYCYTFVLPEGSKEKPNLGAAAGLSLQSRGNTLFQPDDPPSAASESVERRPTYALYIDEATESTIQRCQQALRKINYSEGYYDRRFKRLDARGQPTLRGCDSADVAIEKVKSDNNALLATVRDTVIESQGDRFRKKRMFLGAGLGASVIGLLICNFTLLSGSAGAEIASGVFAAALIAFLFLTAFMTFQAYQEEPRLSAVYAYEKMPADADLKRTNRITFALNFIAGALGVGFIALLGFDQIPGKETILGGLANPFGDSGMVFLALTVAFFGIALAAVNVWTRRDSATMNAGFKSYAEKDQAKQKALEAQRTVKAKIVATRERVAMDNEQAIKTIHAELDKLFAPKGDAKQQVEPSKEKEVADLLRADLERSSLGVPKPDPSAVVPSDGQTPSLSSSESSRNASASNGSGQLDAAGSKGLHEQGFAAKSGGNLPEDQPAPSKTTLPTDTPQNEATGLGKKA